jgi:hypothetical protein
MMNIEILPVLLPLFIASLVFAFVCFGHLAFKNVSIKKICMVMAVLSVPFSLFFTKMLNIAVFEFDIAILTVHIWFLILLFAIIFVRGLFRVKKLPSLIQMIGPIVACAGVYFFLA